MGSHFLLKGIFSTQEFEPVSPALAGIFFISEPSGKLKVSSVQFSSVAQSCPTLCDPMNRSMPGLPVHYQLSEFTQTHVHQAGDAIQPTHPLSSPFLLPPIPPSIRVLSNESTVPMRWPKHWSFSFSVSPSKESGLPFPSPVDLILSDLSTMTRRSWVAPHGMA